jgi:lysophospholipase L1-like esterase/pimeloyl-ACP methyl ester carboxylesterase
MNLRIFDLILVIFFLPLTSLFAQDSLTSWDKTIKMTWPTGFQLKEITSSTDGSIQKAWFYTSSRKEPQPLIISLHTWSGDFNQEDPVAKEVQLRNWNYIHPNFRGPNNSPEACVSDLVISDLRDAILFAVKNANVDTSNIHIIGVSGGGYATLAAYLKLDYPVKSFSSWAGISDLESWYWESKGRGLRYANDVEQVTTGGKGFSASDARKRSPIYMPFDPGLRKGASLHIYAGIHDGYTGSVPVSQSVTFFNRILRERFPQSSGRQISDSVIISLLSKQINPNPDTAFTLGGRDVHLYREAPGLSLTLFEGTHEMLVPQALALIPVNDKRNTSTKNILTIGDSNGAATDGWPEQLRKLLPFSTIVNKSIAGNTIGFDNLDNQRLNTIRNINRYLEQTYRQLSPGTELDYIFVELGTNDTKRIFINRQEEVPGNLATLIRLIKTYMTDNHHKMPVICILSPPPVDEQKVDAAKYGGADERIQNNNQLFREVASNNQVDYLDLYTPLKAGFSAKTTDGVHLTENAQFELSNLILQYLEKH